MPALLGITSNPRKSKMKAPHGAWFSCRACLAATAVVLVLFGLCLRSKYQLGIALGDSMLPTLTSGSLLVIDKRAYGAVEPERGDIIVARHAGGLIVKRVVGFPGEQVEVRQGRLYINGTRAKENHAIYPGYLFVGEGKMLAGDYATLGDNRAIAPALAVHPIITKADILGKVILVIGTQTL